MFRHQTLAALLASNLIAMPPNAVAISPADTRQLVSRIRSLK